MKNAPQFTVSWMSTLLSGASKTSEIDYAAARGGLTGMVNYYPVINTLRAISALLVCFFHFSNYSDFRGNLVDNEILREIGKFGCHGVSVFFVISGFAIPLSLARDGFHAADFHRYLLKRLIRIEVPYIASILLIFGVKFCWELYYGSVSLPEARQIVYHLFYLIPFTNYEWYNVIYWTLALEFQFYLLIIPLYLLLCSRHLTLRYGALAAFIASGLVFSDFRLITSYSGVFGAGILLFLIKTRKIGRLAAFIFLVFCLVTAFIQQSTGTCIAVLLSFAAINFLSFSFVPGNRLGEMSYSFYLTHGLIGGNIIFILGFYSAEPVYRCSIILLAMLCSLLFAWIYWRMIESPSKKWADRIFIKLKKRNRG